MESRPGYAVPESHQRKQPERRKGERNRLTVELRARELGHELGEWYYPKGHNHRNLQQIECQRCKGLARVSRSTITGTIHATVCPFRDKAPVGESDMAEVERFVAKKKEEEVRMQQEEHEAHYLTILAALDGSVPLKKAQLSDLRPQYTSQAITAALRWGVEKKLVAKEGKGSGVKYHLMRSVKGMQRPLPDRPRTATISGPASPAPAFKAADLLRRVRDAKRELEGISFGVAGDTAPDLAAAMAALTRVEHKLIG